ncbi:hypothetical protein [Rhizobium sp. 007]|uniref:hypothetical protein n=1 Tax=Rhizobium sp. 007 TaxID=2785056 RepID=UPI001FED430F|nr:hypothetical protein [Rhizobium sp. 007]
MMEQDAVLQRRQAINVLDVADAAGNRGDDPVDLSWVRSMSGSICGVIAVLSSVIRLAGTATS